jgi:hypothetical protein
MPKRSDPPSRNGQAPRHQPTKARHGRRNLSDRRGRDDLHIPRLVEGYVAAALSALASKGFELRIGHDFQEFGDIWRKLAGDEELNSIFDPSCSHLTPDISFWAGLAREGRYSALVACRYYETRNLRQLVATRQFYVTKQPTVSMGYLDGLSKRFPSLKGRLAYQGSFYAAPAVRGTGLPLLLGRAARMLSIRFFDPDWMIGNCRGGIAASSLPLGAYGYSNIIPCLTPAGITATGEDQFFLMWSSVEEMATRLASEIPE